MAVVLGTALLFALLLVWRSVSRDSYHRPAVAAALCLSWITGLGVTAFLAFFWGWESPIGTQDLITGIALIDETAAGSDEFEKTVSRLVWKVRSGGGRPMVLSYNRRPDDGQPDGHPLPEMDGRFPSINQTLPLLTWIQKRHGPVPIAVYSDRYPEWLAEAVPRDWVVSWIDASPSARKQRALKVFHPQSAFVKQPFMIRVSPPAVTGRYQLTLYRDGITIESRPFEELPAVEAIDFEVAVEDPGNSLFHLTLKDGENTVLSEYTFALKVFRKPAVTYVSPIGAAAPLAKLLERTGFRVSYLPPSTFLNLDKSTAVSDPNALLVLDSIPVPLISQDEKERLSAMVRDHGTRLLYIPGADVGKDGRGSPLEEILPVVFGYRDPDTTDDSLAFVAIVDASMSMFYTAGGTAGHGAFGDNPTGPVSKIQMAKKALENLASAIPDDNRFGVLTVTSSPSWVIRPSKARNREKEFEAISRIYAWGPGINLYSGLLAAFEEISTTETDLKHILVFLDTADVDEYQVADRGTVWELIRDLREQKISVSLIGFGKMDDDHIPQLNRFAEESGGFFYLSSDIEEIPGFGLTDLDQITDSLVNFQVEKVRFFSSDFPGMDSMPDLQGQVVTTLKPGGTLYAWSDRKLPLFAAWSIGKGRVAVFNSDSGLSLSREWSSQATGAAWLSLMAKLVEPDDRGPALFFTSEGEEDILYAATDIREKPSDPRALARMTDGTTYDLELHKVGANRYAARVGKSAVPIRSLEVSTPDRNGRASWSAMSLIPHPSSITAPSSVPEFRPRNVGSRNPSADLFDPFLFRLLLLYIVLVVVIEELFRPPLSEQ